MVDEKPVVVVIPTYNEARNIAKTIEAVLDTRLKNVRVLVVDDGSPDGTGQIVADLSAKNPRILLHNRGAKKGLGSAYYEGFLIALKHDPEVVVSMDADGSHPADLIPDLVEAVKSGADAAVASRYVFGGKWAAGFWRMIVSRGANFLARIATGAKIHDVTSGFRAYSSRAVQHLVTKPFERGYVFQVELLHRLVRGGFRVVEIPFVFVQRREGKSKLSSREILRFFIWCVKILVKRVFGG